MGHTGYINADAIRGPVRSLKCMGFLRKQHRKEHGQETLKQRYSVRIYGPIIFQQKKTPRMSWESNSGPPDQLTTMIY